MTTETLEITGKRLAQLRAGLNLMRERRLPNGETDSLVSSLWFLLKPAVDAYDAAIERVQRKLTDAHDLEDEDQRDREARQAQRDLDAINAFVHQVPRPMTVLGPQHLPKAYKGEQGQMNPAGNAFIITSLHPELYADPALTGLQEAVADGEDDEGEG